MSNNPHLAAYGRSEKADPALGPLPLSEVTLIADPALLREVAAFLVQCADALERQPSFEHRHLRDCWKNWRPEFADVIVFNREMAEAVRRR